MQPILSRLIAGIALVMPAIAYAGPCFHLGQPVVCPIDPSTSQPLPDGSTTLFISFPLTCWQRPNGTTVFISGTTFTPFVAAPAAPPPVVGPTMPNQARDVLALTAIGDRFPRITVAMRGGDVTDDDRLDLIVAHQGTLGVQGNQSVIATLLGDGTGSTMFRGDGFPDFNVLTVGASPDVDATPDIVVATTRGTVLILESGPDLLSSTPDMQSAPAPAARPGGVTVPDATSDSVADLIAINRGSGNVSTHVSGSQPGRTGGQPQPAAVAAEPNTPVALLEFVFTSGPFSTPNVARPEDLGFTQTMGEGLVGPRAELWPWERWLGDRPAGAPSPEERRVKGLPPGTTGVQSVVVENGVLTHLVVTESASGAEVNFVGFIVNSHVQGAFDTSVIGWAPDGAGALEVPKLPLTVPPAIIAPLTSSTRAFTAEDIAKAREAAEKMRAPNNLKRIALDLANADPAAQERGKQAFASAAPALKAQISTALRTSHLSAAQIAGDAINYYVSGEAVDANSGQTQEYRGIVVRNIEESKKRPLLQPMQ